MIIIACIVLYTVRNLNLISYLWKIGIRSYNLISLLLYNTP